MSRMLCCRFILVLGLLLTARSVAESPISITLDPRNPGAEISPSFIGLSFEMQRVLAGTNGFHLFSTKNKQLIATFKTLGVKSLRVGGNTADRANLPLPSREDVDNLFAFAKATDVKVIYTLRLRENDAATTSEMAKYILQRYRHSLDCFAIGNEPNVFSTNYATYVAGWKRYAATIIAAAPDAKFCGPSVSPGHESWSRDFANDLGPSGLLKFISQHDYPGGDGRSVKDPAASRAKILAPAMDAHYSKFADVFVPSVLSNSLPYRLEEANSFYDGGALNVSDTYASALWALNYMWWWASRGASGVNFHTGDTVAARNDNAPCKYAVFWTSPDGYNVHPIGYALKAFALGGHGKLLPMKSANQDNVNLSAFAVLDHGTIYLTLINKENGTDARSAKVKLTTVSNNARAKIIYLSAPNGDLSSKTDVKLGGAVIRDDGSWNEEWTSLENKNSQITITLAPATAAVIQFKAKSLPR